MKERTPAYIATIDFSETDTQSCKLRVAEILRTTFKNPRGIRIRGRLGPDSPYASLYRVGGPLHRYTAQDIKIEHAARVDLYFKS